MSPANPRAANFDEQLAAAGAAFDRANVTAIYCVHGTFVGNDLLGLSTELSRFAPSLSKFISRCGKRVVDLFTGEAGNYTRHFASVFEDRLSTRIEKAIPVRLFHWSSQNNHIARADGAIRLIDELASVAEAERPSEAEPRRILLWGHSHGGNVLALIDPVAGSRSYGTRYVLSSGAKLLSTLATQKKRHARLATGSQNTRDPVASRTTTGPRYRHLRHANTLWMAVPGVRQPATFHPSPTAAAGSRVSDAGPAHAHASGARP